MSLYLGDDMRSIRRILMRDQSSIARSGQRDAAGDRGLQTQPTEIGSQSAAVGIHAAGL